VRFWNHQVLSEGMAVIETILSHLEGASGDRRTPREGT
jgi:very-short-patch-repair endonuclease